MSINTWIPEADLNKQMTQVSNEELIAYINIGNSADIATHIEQLTPKNIDAIMALIKKEISFWQSVCTTFSSAEIIALMRFFALAEEKHSSLFAGKSSCVIALNKLLKSRNEKLDKDTLLWLRENSTNRFIPNGSAL